MVWGKYFPASNNISNLPYFVWCYNGKEHRICTITAEKVRKFGVEILETGEFNGHTLSTAIRDRGPTYFYFANQKAEVVKEIKRVITKTKKYANINMPEKEPLKQKYESLLIFMDLLVDEFPEYVI